MLTRPFGPRKIMEINYIAEIKKGSLSWNEFRKTKKGMHPSLRDINFVSELPNPTNIYSLPELENYDFSNCDLHGSSFRNGFYTKCNFDFSSINWADLVDAYFSECTFKSVSMRVSKIGNGHFINCNFENADLSYCSAEETDFTGSIFINTCLEYIRFVKCNFSETEINSCYFYGTSTWDIVVDKSIQRNNIITSKDENMITVDNIELAQFIYLLINNAKLRDVIDTITSKVVLILGNFSEERKAILDLIREGLRKYDYIPVLFDFDKPTSRNLTETVITIASMSKYIIADISSPRSIPQELASLIPRLQSVNIYPIIQKNEKPYGMFQDFYSYNSVKKIIEYLPSNLDNLINIIVDDDKKDVL
jgi:uncharacterized protein YjbI with pentapeptide repeats